MSQQPARGNVDARTPSAARVRSRRESWFLPLTLLAMLALYALVYHPYQEGSLPGRYLIAYLELVAHGSALLLGGLGESVSVQGTTVLGRFPFVVVLDCAALDAQALFSAAVLAFPARLAHKLLGLGLGLPAIAALNVARLALLYFAGAYSQQLFQVLHEEVLVLVVVLSVCALFASWACWTRSAGRSLSSSNAHA